MKNKIEKHVTLWPSFEHFIDIASRDDVSGVRLNTAKIVDSEEMESEIRKWKAASLLLKKLAPVHLDVKGWQLRVVEVDRHEDLEMKDRYLSIKLNHRVHFYGNVLGSRVWFKAGKDVSTISKVDSDGQWIHFNGGPYYNVEVGESLHFENAFRVRDEMLLEAEIQKIEVAEKLGVDGYYLSYVHSLRDVEMLRELVGNSTPIFLKIEDRTGINFALRRYEKAKLPNTRLVVARGDLFCELRSGSEILTVTRDLVRKDPEAVIGSRLLLSLVKDTEPSLADLSELAWLYDLGVRSFLFCDELCLKREMLVRALDCFEEFRGAYVPRGRAKAVAGSMLWEQ